MAIDFKLKKRQNNWDLDIENGDFARTDSLDTAVYMSILCERRATTLSEPTLSRGHFSNQFNQVAGFEIGSLFWLYTNQAKNINTSLIEGAIKDGLRWFIDDEIISKANVKATKKDTTVDLEINLINKNQANSKYYNLFVNL